MALKINNVEGELYSERYIYTTTTADGCRNHSDTKNELIFLLTKPIKNNLWKTVFIYNILF